MKHICFVTLSLCKGGAERVLSELCNYYASLQYQVTVITCMNKQSEYVLNTNVKQLCVDKGSYANIGERFIKRRQILKKILCSENPDCIVSFLPEPNFLCLSLKRQVKCPVIISLRNDPNVEYNNLFRKFLMKAFYPRLDGCVFQTQEAREYFKFSKKIYNDSVVIPNAINEGFVCKEAALKKRKVIVSVGRLDIQKNQALLISSFSKIVSKYPEYILEIFGEGKLRETLEQLIEKLGLQNKVFLKGKVDDLSQKIYDAAMFVLTSDYEGMPNALIEAMTLGIPSIATDCPCGGSAFLIRHMQNGQLISMGSEEELVKAIEIYIHNEDKAYQMGINAMKIVDDLSAQNIYSQWDSYIRTIMDKSAKEKKYAEKGNK